MVHPIETRFVYFEWGIPGSGFEWQTSPNRAKESASEALDLVMKVSGEKRVWTYDLLEKNTGLFRSFAALKTPQQMLEFANTYGEMGIRGSCSDVAFREPLLEWERNIREVRIAVKILDAIKSKNQKIANSFLMWNDGFPSVVKVDGDNAQGMVSHGDSFSSLRDEGLLQPKYAVKILIAWLQRLLVDKVNLWSHVVFIQDFDTDESLFRLSITTLIGAIWWQVAQSLTGQGEYRECPTCKKPFEVAPGADRKNKDYCSANCRVKAYHKRKADAKAMRKQGISVKQIAESLNTTATQVKKWVEL